MKNFYLLATFVFLIGCGSNTTLTDEEVEKYTEQGKLIAKASFKKLSGQLKKAMVHGGVDEAIIFCNASAMPLTKGLSTEHNAVIKRTSLKLRNLQNAPDSLEAKMLDMYQIMSRMRKPMMVPKLIATSDTEIKFYAPIMIANETCLKCHGVIGQTMKANDYDIIKKHYPKDEAIDYKLGQFRGMWSITLAR